MLPKMQESENVGFAVLSDKIKQGFKKGYWLNIFQSMKLVTYINPEVRWIMLVGPYAICHTSYTYTKGDEQKYPFDILVGFDKLPSEEIQEKIKENIIAAYNLSWGAKIFRFTMITNEQYRDEIDDACLTGMFDGRTERQTILMWTRRVAIYLCKSGDTLKMPYWFDFDEFMSKYRFLYNITDADIDRYHKHKEEIENGTYKI